MSKNNESVFEEYKDLYELTRKTVDDHIDFYKKKESLSEGDLFALWKKLSHEASNFDKNDWTENWYNWHKNFHAFEKHKFEAKFLIQHYLTDVLEEMITRLVEQYSEHVKLVVEKEKHPQEITDNKLSSLIRDEVKRQVKEELASQKRKTKKNTRSPDPARSDRSVTKVEGIKLI